VRIFLLGRQGGITHWLEDAARAFAALGHDVALGFVRRPWIPIAVERSLVQSSAQALERRVRRFAPDLILAIGGFHVPPPILERLAAAPGRPPLIGWVGDVFDEGARELAGLYDAVGYTDTALVARHRVQAFGAAALWLPHAADPSGAWPATAAREPRMVFVGNPTPGRRAIIAQVREPLVLFGPGWRAQDGPHHHRHPRRTPPSALRAIYGRHRLALNIRNERNVLAGLNQRNFDPCLAGAALVTDDQPDLAACFEPGREVAVWRDADELDGLYERLLRDSAEATAIAARGRRRVLADHTYGARLDTLAALA
jgi:spore maturation protein CgeB